jgi:hypothetical protein
LERYLVSGCFKRKGKPVMVVHVCNPSSWEAEAGGLKVQGQLWLHGEFKGSLGYIMRCYLKKTKKEGKGKKEKEIT